MIKHYCDLCSKMLNKPKKNPIRTAALQKKMDAMHVNELCEECAEHVRQMDVPEILRKAAASGSWSEDSPDAD